MSMSNVSEQLFEEYCILRCYPFKRIDTGAGKERLPDYEVQTPRGAVVCEVKEIRPNVEDEAFDKKLKKYRYAHIIGRPLGKRAGAKLEDARGQLRRFQNDPRPCLLVILDKTFHSYLTPGEIDAAMFGDPLALFSTNPVDHRIELTRGGNRRLNEERDVYVGALAVLHHSESEGGIRLDIYHNPFTSKSVSPAYFPDLQDRHYVKKGDPNETGHGWQEYVGPRNDA
jgi:hypothetical protein